MELLINEDSCRICLINDSESTNIYETYEDKLISDMIVELSGVKIEEDDSLSKQICKSCKNKLIEFVEFRQLCIDSDETVRYNLMIVEENEMSIEEEYIIQDETETIQSYDEILEENEEKIVDQYIIDEEEDQENVEEELEIDRYENEQKTRLSVDELPPCDEVTVKMREVHFAREQKKKHQCPHCDKCFMFPSKVARHVNAVHKNPEEPKKIVKKNHPCKICGKLFVSQFKVRRHMVVHDNELKIGLQKNWSKGYMLCKECNKKFHSQTTFDRHKLICGLLKSSLLNRPENYKYSCVICSEQFESHDIMVDHMKTHPLIDGYTFQCSLCDGVSESSSLQEIIKHGRYHEENVTYQCSVCFKKYPNGDEIVAHLLRHKDYKPFNCEQCGKSFFDKYKLKQHLNTHDPNAPKNFICQYCKKAFGAQDYLNCHIRRKHMDEKPHKCEFCSKSFAFLHDLNVHLTIHTGDKKHICSICDASFAKAWSLRQHINNQHRDSDSSSFQCQLCSFSTTNREKFESHLTSHEDENVQNSEMIKMSDPQLSSFDALSDDTGADEYDLVEIQTF